MFILGYQSADAQQNIAQEAYAIFEQNCLSCHGESGAYKDSLLIDRAALVDTQVVIPGDPENSEFYKRLLGPTNNGAQMPLNLPPLSQNAIDTIAHWITEGAPDWDIQYDINFITTDAILDTIQAHLASLDPFDRPSARYFTLTHLYNAGESPQTLSDYRIALSKLINSLSWKFEITNPTPIDTAQTIFYIDLRRYEWNTRTDVWALIEQAYPYHIEFDPATQAGLIEKLTQLQTETGSTVPFVHVDWFLATASLPPLYHDILDLPLTDRILETQLEVNVAGNIRNAPGIDVWRAGFNDSGVSAHNRVVERHSSRYGAYWKSYDFAGSTGSQHIFTHPLDFTHDGGEIIFNLPNGLQAYLLVDANGNRLDVAPIEIVSNPAASDPAVRNGLSCIGCHDQGMKTFTDSVRAVIEQDQNPPYNKEQALRLYPEQSVLNELLQKDTNRFLQALEKIGGPFEDEESRQRFFKRHENEPIQRLHEAFQAPLDASHAAAAIGLETAEFLTQIREKQILKNLGLLTLTDTNGTVKRDAWTSNFHNMISALNTPNSVLPPVVERPERIPGAGVHIPDPNLRAAIEEALGKTTDDVITVEDLTTLGRLEVVEKDISDLTGLEFATNLKELNIEANKVSDLTPIAGLIELRVLNFVNNQISDLSPISELKKVNYLVINHNPISNISAIANLAQLNYLQMSHISGVSDISELAGLINLQTFHCWGSPIVDMSPLVNLPKLEILDLCGAKLSHIPSLDNLKSLKTLYLVDCNISDLSSLSSLKSLEHFIKLNLHRNNIISDISPLAVLTNLTWLNLSWNNISNVSSLSDLTNLKWLSLELNNISDVFPLAKLTNLEWLDLTKNPITNFSSLAKLAQNTNIIAGNVNIPDRNLRAAIADALGKGDSPVVAITFDEMATLTTLRASNRDIKDLTGIEHAINLEELWVSKNPVSDISPLAKLANLIGLGAWETPISDLSPLSGSKKLRWLDFGRTPTDANRDLIGNLDLSPLVGITSLKKLTFYACGIKDISPLANLTGLTQLAVGGNRLSDVTPAAGLINLEHLDVHHGALSDLAPLAKLTRLRVLNLFDNKYLSDLSPLTGLISLTHLELQRNLISDVSPLSGLTNLEKLFLQENLIEDISPLKKLPKSTYINWLKNPGAPIGGQKIEGPWLWVLVPGERLDSDTDLLAEASNGSVTEHQIATGGATDGRKVGENEWTSHEISPIGRDNVREMLSVLGLSEDDKTRINVVYGSAILDSQREQNTKMFVGTAGNHKIWLNGELIHEDLKSNRIAPHDYDMFFPITLEQGVNILLVAVDNHPHWDRFECYFGFEEGTEYTVVPPGVGFSFSATETKNLLAGDTFTLNLNAENITDLAGWQADIAFDPNVLEAVEVIESDFLKTEGGDTFFQGGTIDNTAGKITSLYSARIAESGVSGTGTLLSVTFKAKAEGKTQVTLQNFEFSSVTGDIIPTVPPNMTITVSGYPAWDVNQDGRVSIIDLVLVANDFGSGAPVNLRTDVNRDGVINIQDLIIVANHFGESTDSAAASPILVVDSEKLTPEVVQAWIEQAQVENDGSLAFRQGIENLQRLLASFIPEKTVLLANYPNPFNPETWIPYNLAKPAEVTLTIYAANGAVVRILALGYQAAGIYQNRSRAAHWDGRNDIGESVASGIYFYTLTAGDFTATRKMLILK